MKRTLPRWGTIVLLVAAITFTMVIVACGGDATPTPTTAAAAPAAAPTPTTAAAAVAAATATPTRAAVAAVATPTTAAQAPAPTATSTPTTVAAAAVARELVSPRLKVAMVPPGNQVTMYYRTFNSSGGPLRNMYDHLVSADHVTGEYGPYLSTGWTVGGGGKDWTFKLREGVPFHSAPGWAGGEFTSEDVIRSYEIIQLPPGLASPAGFISKIGDQENIEVIDDHEFVFHFATPWFDVPWNFATDWTFTIYSSEYWDKVGEDAYNAHPVGTGPFQFVELTINEHFLYERFKEPGEAHWWAIPEFDELQLLFVPEEATRLAMLLTHEAHISDISALSMPSAESAGFQRARSTLPGFQVFNIIGGLFPESHEDYDPNNVLLDIRIREAINLAIDREQILDTFFSGRGELGAVYNMPPFQVPYDFEKWVPYSYDPERAKELLEEAGYPEGTLDLRVLVGTNMSGVPEAPDVAEAEAAMLSSVGINVTLDAIEYGQVGAQIRGHELSNTIVVSRFGLWPVGNSWPLGMMGEGNWVIIEDEYLRTKYDEYKVADNVESARNYELMYGQHLYEEYAIAPLVWLFPEVAYDPTVVLEYNVSHAHMGPSRYHVYTKAVYK